ncbi:hypothetical protein [Pyrococcus yayanosii]|uniref:Uncharacterized protein n=1 Tax=Pyrococcus yayanosii (strain CH1 / JCM 16557) TaxID=529709 RepID=F8AJC1_PYRYC|nr:hypothetical protein [Pyrococcus yayanosii]AEH24568.1 hypothetical protein PYCH_08830 [Pyrococcus yayanosii CH1]
MRRLLVFFLLALLLAPLVLADEYGEHGDEYGAGYSELAALGVGLIAVGVVYYSLTKRKLLIAYKKSGKWGFEIRLEHPYVMVTGPVHPLTIHQVFALTGTLLVFLHFFSCYKYGGLAGGTGLAMGIVLVLLNVTGFIGRYIHGKVLLAARKHEGKMAKIAGTLGHWKKVHIALAVLFAILLAIHLATVD